MNNNLEKNNRKKDRRRRRNINNAPVNKFTNDKIIETTERRFRDGGFIAWPENKIAQKNEFDDNGIIEGRSKKGGFIAFPDLNHE